MLFVELIVCIASLTVAFHHWRRYPILNNAINFHRFHWLALFFSLGIFAVGGICVLLAKLIDILGVHYFHSAEKYGLGFPFAMLSFPFILAGFYAALLTAVYCDLRLLLALLSHIRFLQSKPAS